MYTFPDVPVTRNYKINEKHVLDFIMEQFQDNNIQFNKKISGGCSRKIPYFFIEMCTHSIIIEIDENQHSNYICENKRTMILFTDLADRPLVMIRFNPDSFLDKDNKKIESCFEYTKQSGAPFIKNK